MKVDIKPIFVGMLIGIVIYALVDSILDLAPSYYMIVDLALLFAGMAGGYLAQGRARTIIAGMLIGFIAGLILGYITGYFTEFVETILFSIGFSVMGAFIGHYFSLKKDESEEKLKKAMKDAYNY